jgi:hypothetical protein
MTRAFKAAAAFDIIISSFERAGIIPFFEPKDNVYLKIDLSKSARLTFLCTHVNYAQPSTNKPNLHPFPKQSEEAPMLFRIKSEQTQQSDPALPIEQNI